MFNDSEDKEEDDNLSNINIEINMNKIEEFHLNNIPLDNEDKDDFDR